MKRSVLLILSIVFLAGLAFVLERQRHHLDADGRTVNLTETQTSHQTASGPATSPPVVRNQSVALRAMGQEPILKLLEAARLVAQKEVQRPGAAGARTPVLLEVYETSFKYPLVRVERLTSGEIHSVAVADHVLVRRQPGVSHEQFSALVGQAGLQIRKRLYGDSGYLVAGSAETVEAIEDLRSRLNKVTPAASTTLIEPDFIATIQAMPNDSHFSRLWGMNNGNDADIDAPEAWDVATSASNIIVGVIDTGIDYNHPDLAANIWANPGEVSGNGMDDDGNGLIDDVYGYDFYNEDADPMDDHYHGTHCAGTIGAVGNNGIGVAGVSWAIRMMGLKFLNSSGSGAVSDAIQCIAYATEAGARLTSNSWGSFFPSGVTALSAAIQEAGDAGVLYVGAAGNNGLNLETTGAGGYPARLEVDTILSVAATDTSDQLASFSNYGTNKVDIAAPGVSVYSTLPDDSYGYLSGTSMATPHVAGACALLLGQQPTLTPRQVKAHVMGSADRISHLAGKLVTGGRLNIRRMLQGLATDLPQITSATQFSAFTGQSVTYMITADNHASIFDAAGLPHGLTVDRETGAILGSTVDLGTYSIDLSAANVIGTATQTLALTIVPPPPVISSSNTAVGVVNEVFAYQITVENDAQSYGATGLPAGLSINVVSGRISGLPQQAGDFTVQLWATNSGGTGELTLGLHVDLPPAPEFLGPFPLEATAVIDLPFTYQILATYHPTVFSATGLPSGLTINTTNGIISGVPSVTGNFTVTLQAQNPGGQTTNYLQLAVYLVGPPVISEPLIATGQVDQVFAAQVQASRIPTSYSATGLPVGLSISAGGLISGSPAQAGTFNVRLAASNSDGTGLARLGLTILPRAPVITSPTLIVTNVFQPLSYTITATEQPISFGASGLPVGLTVNTASGSVTGVVQAIGVHQFVASASNSGGVGSATITINALPATPVISGSLNAVIGKGEPFIYQIIASNQPDIYGVTNLPPGLLLDSTFGRISGSVTNKGTYYIGISAANAGGAASATLTLLVDDGPTRITAFTPPEVLPGGTITITGVGFTGATNVYFSSGNSDLVVCEQFQVMSDTEIHATVPYLTGANGTDSSWIIVVSPRGLGVAFPPTTLEVFEGYDLGGAGSRRVIVHPGGALIAGGGGGNRIAVESGGSATLSGGVSVLFVSDHGLVDLSGGGSVGTLFHSPAAIIVDEPSASASLSATVRREVSSVRVTTLNPALKVRQVPRITSPTEDEAVVGELYSYQIAGFPGGLTYGLAGSPPPGLDFQIASGMLRGVPTAPGIYVLPFSVTNSQGYTTFSLTLMVTGDPIPVITSSTTAEGDPGLPFSYQITAANSPTAFGATGLPPGFSIESATGLITGAPITNDIYSVLLSATNSFGSATRTVTFFIGASPLAITSFSPASIASGTEVTITGRGFHEVERVQFINGGNLITGLDLTIDSDETMRVKPPSAMSSSPLIAVGTSHATVTFPANAIHLTSSGTYSGGGSAHLIVESGISVNLGGAGSLKVYVKAGSSVTVGGGGSLVFYLETGSTVDLAGGGGGPVIFQSLGSTVLNPGSASPVSLPSLSLSSLTNNTLFSAFNLPAITSGSVTGLVGTALNYSVTLSGSTFGITYGAHGLPPGLSIATNTGVVSGTPIAAGLFSVQLSATNSQGGGAKTVTFAINPALPTLTSGYRVDGSVGIALNFQLTALHGPVTFQSSDLPPELSLTSSGLIAGTPGQSGVWIATVNMTNANGFSTARLTVAIDRPQPVLTSPPVSVVPGGNHHLGGSNLAHTTAVLLKPGNGLASLGTATVLQSIAPSQVDIVTPLSGLGSSMLLTLLAQGGATVTLPTTMIQVTSGSSVSISGGSGYYRVRSGGTLSGNGGGSLTIYAESGSQVILTGGGSQTLFAENGARIDLSNANGILLHAPNAIIPNSNNFTLIQVPDLKPTEVANFLTLSPIPVITSANTAKGYLHIPFYFIVKAANSPSSFSAAGLPAGLSLNPVTGSINGAPSVTGVFNVLLTTTNATGSFTGNWTLTIGDPLDYWRDTSFASLVGGSDNPLADDYADADGDGLLNVWEYAGKLNPNAPNQQNDLFELVRVGDQFGLAYRRLKGSGTGSAVAGYSIGGVQYFVEGSTNLSQWYSGALHFEQASAPIDNGDGSENVIVRMRRSVFDDASAFLRFRIERTE